MVEFDQHTGYLINPPMIQKVSLAEFREAFPRTFGDRDYIRVMRLFVKQLFREGFRPNSIIIGGSKFKKNTDKKFSKITTVSDASPKEIRELRLHCSSIGELSKMYSKSFVLNGCVEGNHLDTSSLEKDRALIDLSKEKELGNRSKLVGLLCLESQEILNENL